MRTLANQISSALNMYYSGMSINDIRNFLHQEYGNFPSSKTVYIWLDKYTVEAMKGFRGYHPTVGDTWVADETVLRINGENIWMYDIIDEKTRFILASRVAVSRTTHQAELLMREAYKLAGKAPNQILTDQNRSYLDGIELTFGSETDHKLSRPFVSEDSTNMIERFHGTLKERTKVMRGLKSTDTAIQFLDGFLVYYNFLRPHEGLNGKTPAEVAKIIYPFKCWADIIRNVKPHIEVLTTPENISVLSEPKPLVRPVIHRHYDLKTKSKQRRLRSDSNADKHQK